MLLREALELWHPYVGNELVDSLRDRVLEFNNSLLIDQDKLLLEGLREHFLDGLDVNSFLDIAFFTVVLFAAMLALGVL